METRKTVFNPSREQAVAYLDARDKPYEEKDILFVMQHMALHYFPIYEAPEKKVCPHCGK